MHGADEDARRQNDKYFVLLACPFNPGASQRPCQKQRSRSSPVNFSRRRTWASLRLHACQVQAKAVPKKGKGVFLACFPFKELTGQIFGYFVARCTAPAKQGHTKAQRRTAAKSCLFFVSLARLPSYSQGAEKGQRSVTGLFSLQGSATEAAHACQAKDAAGKGKGVCSACFPPRAHFFHLSMFWATLPGYSQGARKGQGSLTVLFSFSLLTSTLACQATAKDVAGRGTGVQLASIPCQNPVSAFTLVNCLARMSGDGKEESR